MSHSITTPQPCRWTVATIIALCLALVLLGGVDASASPPSVPAPAWSLQSITEPTSFAAADNGFPCVARSSPPYKNCQRYTLQLTDIGTRPSTGTVTVIDTLPEGITTAHPPFGQSEKTEFAWSCTTATAGSRETVTCTYEHPVAALTGAPGIEIPVTVSSALGTGTVLSNEVQVSGGEAAEVKQVSSSLVATPPSTFAPTEFMFSAVDAAGVPDTRAASHPGGFVSSFAFPSSYSHDAFRGHKGQDNEGAAFPVENVKQIVTDLPPGLIGDALSAPTCSVADVSNLSQEETECPAGSRIGRLALLETQGDFNELTIYNVTPEPGHVAEFAVFLPNLQRASILYPRLVGTGAQAHVRVVGAPLPNTPILPTAISLTFFGVPAAIDQTPVTPVALATNPADCAASGFTSTLYVDTWQNPGRMLPDGEPDLSDPAWKRASTTMPPVTGCGSLHFDPSLSFFPEPGHTGADEPAGYQSVLQIPQNEDVEGLATPPLKSATVTLPSQVAVSPSAANGLVGCVLGAAGIGLENEEEANQPGHCPTASKIGTAIVKTPLLTEPLEGSVYVAQPSCSPCSEAQAEQGEVFSLYVEVGSEERGAYIKQKGTVEVGGNGEYSRTHGLAPGQVRTTFADTPQQPFSELKLSFNGGPRAPLANPQTCGSFASTAELEAWSHQPAPGEEAGTPNVTLNPAFTITGCESKFAPSFTAGTLNPQAGAFSAFSLTLSRHDREQDLAGLTVNMPEGLLGRIAGIAQCADAQAGNGTCPAASRVGTATAAAGAGERPLWQSGGVYLTGPYKGAPFGLSVVVPAKAGPYDLGNVVVRAALYIDPHTAQVTVVSDPLPQMVDGVPLRVQTVNVTVGQESNFTFNPTSCEPMQVTATVSSAQGASVPVASHFQAGNCQALPFTPVLTASTQGHTSKQNGASLHVHIASPGIGQAGIHKVELTIPTILPSRLTTLQKACTEAQFNSNPAGCPAASDIATATVHTPLLNSPLVGPVYFVSHGGAAFPDTEMVLQGEGVELLLVGHTDIKKGVTYSRFETVPDAPFTSFEFNAPEGPYSIFGANGNLCTSRIVMPTTITGQSGAVLRQETDVEPEGCPNAITILSHSVKKQTITLRVAVPSAGKLTASGKNLSKATKATTGRGPVTVVLRAAGHGKHKTKVKLTFTPSKGGKLTAAVAVKLRT